MMKKIPRLNQNCVSPVKPLRAVCRRLWLLGFYALGLYAVTAQAQESRPAPEINASSVLDFGAVGDGAADDTAALQRAVDESGAVWLPRGTYRITRPVVVDLDRAGPVAVRGDGTATILMDGAGPALHLIGTHAGTAAPKSLAPDVWARQRAPRIDGLVIVGLHPASDGIRVEGTLQAILSSITVRHARHGIHLTGRNRNVIIEGSHLYENSGIGIYLDRVNLHQINIASSHISYNGGGGIVVRGGEVRNLHIGTSDIEANMSPDAPPTANILLDAREGTIREGAIVGCTIQHTGAVAGSANIRMIGRDEAPPRAAGRFTIADNAMSDVAVNIHLRYARGVTITGNTLWKATEQSLLVEQSEQIVVANTLFERNPDYAAETPDGLLFRDSRDVTLTGLHIHGTKAPAALHLQRCAWFNITNTMILDPEHTGLLLEEVDHIRISGCSVRAAGPALRLTSGRGNQVTDNLLLGAVEIAPGTAAHHGSRTAE